MIFEDRRLDGLAGESVLVLESGFDAVPGALASSSPGADPRLLSLDFGPNITLGIDTWTRRLGVTPSELVVVTGAESSETAADATVVTVSSPADLTGIGVETTKHLGRWRESVGATPVVVFDSLTVALQYASTRPLYRFLHVLTLHLARAGALGVFFLDPAASDDRTVHTLSSLFDAVAERADDGWAVRTR